ncbi:MAG TPA: type I-B CRISPR-associated protein Cas5b [Pseudothermotoga sp.]
MKVLVFDVFGRYAIFRRSYTTTSSTSYCFPPRTAICGLLGAILGIENEATNSSKHLRTFDQAHIAVRSLKPVRKVNLSTNYIDTRSGHNQRTQILLELIKSPAYRVYISEFEKFEQLKYHLENKISIFTPYLGQAQMIADFSYVGCFQITQAEPPIELHTVMKITGGTIIEPQRDQILIKEQMVLNMDDERRPTEVASYWIEKNAKPLKILRYSKPIYSINELGENICWID